MTAVHPRVTLRHPELAEKDVITAWESFELAATRVPGEREMRIGYDARGRCLEMVGVLTESGWLVYHAMTPPSKKTLTELRRCQTRRF